MVTETHIRLDSAKMRQTIQIIRNQLNIIRSCHENILNDASRIREAHWDAASADRFVEAIRTMCSAEQVDGKVSAGSIINILRAYMSDLNMVIARSAQTERKLTDIAEALPTSAFRA